MGLLQLADGCEFPPDATQFPPDVMLNILTHSVIHIKKKIKVGKCMNKGSQSFFQIRFPFLTEQSPCTCNSQPSFCETCGWSWISPRYCPVSSHYNARSGTVSPPTSTPQVPDHGHTSPTRLFSYYADNSSLDFKKVRILGQPCGCVVSLYPFLFSQ